MISFDSEKCLEDLLFENQDFLRKSFDLDADHEIRRQVQLGAYGTADIVALKAYRDVEHDFTYLDVVIFELKNTPLALGHVSQIARYKRFFDSLYIEHDIDHVEIKGILIGKKTFPTGDDLVFLCQSIDWLETYEFSIDPLAGLKFGWVNGWVKSGEKTQDFDAFVDTLDIKNRGPLPSPPLESQGAEEAMRGDE